MGYFARNCLKHNSNSKNTSDNCTKEEYSARMAKSKGQLTNTMKYFHMMYKVHKSCDACMR